MAQLLAAAARSASARINDGSLPPSSRTHGLMAAPARAATAFPARTLPVKLTARTRGSSIRFPVASKSMKRLANSIQFMFLLLLEKATKI